MPEITHEHQIPAPGAGTNGLAWQETSLWSVEGPGPIHKIHPQTGEVELTLSPAFPGASGLESDGEYLWYNSIWQQTFYKLTVPALDIVTQFSSPGEGPHGLAWDGEHLWSVDMNTSRFVKQCPETGEILAELPTPGGRAHGLAWDGEALWNADTNDCIIYRIHPESGEVLRTVACPGEPHGLTWDGEALWYGDDAAKTICRLSLSEES